MSRYVLTLSGVLALIGLVLGIGPDPAAATGHNAGVKWVDFADNAHACFDNSPCPDGDGLSNTIYVGQTLVDGEYRYTDVFGTAPDRDKAWLAIELAAECRTGYSMLRGHFEHGHSDWEGWNDPDEAGEWSHPITNQQLDKGHRVMTRKWFPLHVPVDEVLEELIFPELSTDTLLEWGEETVALDIEIGTDPETAREKSYEVDETMDLHAEIMCKGNVFGMEREMHNSATLPLQIIWLGVGQDPYDHWRDAKLPQGPPERDPVPDPVRDPVPDPAPTGPGSAPELPLSDRAWVTDADLFAVPDEADPCRVHLSGVLATNGETEVTYRFTDQLGVHSQSFTVDVDHTLSAMLDHHVDLEPVHVPGTDDELGLSIGGQGDGVIDDYVAQPTDIVQGYYRLEVTSPNHLASAVATYHLPECVAPEPPETVPSRTAPSTSVPSTSVPSTSAPASPTTTEGSVTRIRG